MKADCINAYTQNVCSWAHRRMSLYPSLRCYKCVTSAWVQGDHTLNGYQRMRLDYCSERAFALEHFVQCKCIREEVEHSVRFYTAWPFLVPSKTHRQHHPHSARSVTANRLLLWMSNFIKYTHHDHSFSFHLSKMSDRGHTLFFTPPTRVCVQLYGAVDQTFFHIFFFFFFF